MQGSGLQGGENRRWASVKRIASRTACLLWPPAIAHYRHIDAGSQPECRRTYLCDQMPGGTGDQQAIRTMRGRQGESAGQLMQVTSSSFGKHACGAMIGLTSRRYSIGSKEWFGQISGTSIRPALSPTANSVVKKAATGHSVSFR